MLKFIQRFWKLAVLLPAAFYVGKLVDDSEKRRMSDISNKSKLYGRELKPGEYSPWDEYLKK
ncbi:hypothetical protein X975_12807, partial [Stegodyphus mimosarum]